MRQPCTYPTSHIFSHLVHRGLSRVNIWLSRQAPVLGDAIALRDFLLCDVRFSRKIGKFLKDFPES